ncbi:MAG: DUF4013 domain-containing protein [Candidatus Saccharibacteria bacterium]
MKGLLDDVFKSLKHPINDDDWISKVIVVSILGIAALFGIESFLTDLIMGDGLYGAAWVWQLALALGSCLYFGYLLEVMRAGLDFDDDVKLPELSNWGTLFANGLLVMIINLVYLIVPIIIFFVISAALYSQTVSGLPPGQVGPAIRIRDLCQFVAAIIFVITSFFIPMAVANFLHKESLGAAFALGEIISKIKMAFVDYLKVVQLWIVGIVICVMIMKSWMGLLGLAIVPIVMLYLTSGVFIEVGKIYDKGEPANNE